jgi:hypothetical protein
MRKLYFFILAIVLCSFVNGQAYARILFHDDFDSYSDAPSNHGWTGGTSANFSMQNTSGVNNSRCIMVTYNRSGTEPYWFGKNISNENMQEIFVRFYFKMETPNGASIKHLKLFGKQFSPEGYANSTFALSNGSLWDIGYGNGNGTQNDTQYTIRYSGPHYASDPALEWRKSTSTLFVADNKWHCMEVHMKYNSNDKRDGLYQVWIDGELRLDVANVKNRHNSNSLHFRSVELANYCDVNFTQPFRVWYDNIVISDQYIGTIESNESIDNIAPATPTGLNVISK